MNRSNVNNENKIIENIVVIHLSVSILITYDFVDRGFWQLIKKKHLVFEHKSKYFVNK